MSRPHTNRIVRNLFKMHIKMRRYSSQFLASPEHSTKWGYEVLTQNRQYIYIYIYICILECLKGIVIAN